MPFSLFPKNEDWGSGDEAHDLRLNTALNKCAQSLSLNSISDFYYFAIAIKPRTNNPTFSTTIELVTKALLALFSPNEPNDLLFKKIKGKYHAREIKNLAFHDFELVKQELRTHFKCRYKNQIDFSLNIQNQKERNPFLKSEIMKSPYDLQAKIIFKEFKNDLNEGASKKMCNDPFFEALKLKQTILRIENFAELWFDGNQIFCLDISK